MELFFYNAIHMTRMEWIIEYWYVHLALVIIAVTCWEFIEKKLRGNTDENS